MFLQNSMYSHEETFRVHLTLNRGLCISQFEQITSQIVDFFTSWLPVIIDYQAEEVYLNQSLLFTAFYDSLLKVEIYKQASRSFWQVRHEMKTIRNTSRASTENTRTMSIAKLW